MKQTSGVLGEVYAARLLRDTGYDLIAANYVCRFGELDIVAKKEDVIAIVEVKTRLENSLMSPAEAVDIHKRDRLRRAAQVYMAHTRQQEETFRFDVVEVTVNESFEVVGTNHIVDAFQ